MGYRVEKLNKSHEVEGFDCGVKAQNEYLKKFAWQNMQIGYGVPYVAVSNSSDRVIGFYALAAGKVKFKNVPSSFNTEGLPRYPAPTILLAQLGVDKSAQGQRLGQALLVHAIEKALTISDDLGAVALEVDAASKKARSFYKKFGFVQMKDSPNHLFMSMKVGKTLIEESPPPDSE